MLDEVNELNQYEPNKRSGHLLKRINEALLILNSMPTNIIGNQKNSDYYKLLKNLKKVL